MNDLRAFFDAIRPIFRKGMTQDVVDGVNAILVATRNLPVSHRAYLLATAAHETAYTMQPITEYGGRKYFDKYDTGKLAKDLGNTPQADGDGFKYRGRGYVQITGRANYKRFGIEKTPDDALAPDLAAHILVRGCEDGVFTGKKLSDYLPGDYVNARRVVNGTDDAKEIAALAVKFESALRVIKARPVAPVADHAVTTKPVDGSKAVIQYRQSWLTALAALIKALVPRLTGRK
jgi:putative chitinase